MATEAAAPRQAPPFTAALAALTPEERKAALEATHPDFSARAKSWYILLDAFEGDGGFLDGSYIWPYPREDEQSFQQRCAMARYHNYVAALVDLYVRFMFTQGVKRRGGSPEYQEWLKDVDGAGTEINDYLRQFSALALVAGHACTLVDRAGDAATGPRLSDDQSQVVLSTFVATEVRDWRFAGNVLSGVKLSEAAPEPGIGRPLPDAAHRSQWLLWDEIGWARFNADGELVGSDMPNIGLVPVVILRPQPAHNSRMLGRPIVGNANVVRALYNRASEEDQVIRDQAFSVLTVDVPQDGDVQQVRDALGGVLGTAKALVVKGRITYATPDQAVPGTIRDNISYLVQELYRSAHVRYQRDSMTAESAEALRLQYTELNEMLQGFSKSLAQAEKDIARAWYAWSYPTPEAAEAAFDKDAPDAEWPDEFFLDDLATELKAWAEAIAMDLGLEMTKRIKKRAVRRIDPNMEPDDLKKVDDEIDAMKEDRSVLPPSDFGDPGAAMLDGGPRLRPDPRAQQGGADA